jgi:SAM-dependent methyltransferase
VLRTTAKGLLRRESAATTLAAYPLRLLTDLSIADWREIHANRKLLRAASHFRRTSKAPFELSRFLGAAYGACRSTHLRSDETTTEPSTSCSLAPDSAVETLCCPTHHVALSRRDNDLICPDCGSAAGRWKGLVASFLPEADAFYEGKYNNRTRYVPRNDGYIATLPLRIVHQGYPTAVAKVLPKGSTVVEIGCAGGIDWYGRRYRMIGLDLSEGALKIVAQQYALAVQCDATRMPLASSSVDGIISSCLFEHLLPKQKADLLRESHRVLKPGGKLVFFYDIHTDNPIIAAYRRRRPDLYQTLFLDGDGHLGYDTVEANRRHFAQAGFKIVGEAFHERTPLLANSAWQKLSQWPGALGIAAVVGRTLTSGLARLPSLTAIAVGDVTMGPLFPQRFARGMTTVARKP